MRRSSTWGGGGENVVRRQRTPNPLECELTHRLSRYRILDRHENARTDQDLTGLSFVAKVHDLHHRAEASERDYRRSVRERKSKRSKLAQQLRQLADVRRYPPCLVDSSPSGAKVGAQGHYQSASEAGPFCLNLCRGGFKGESELYWPCLVLKVEWQILSFTKTPVLHEQNAFISDCANRISVFNGVMSRCLLNIAKRSLLRLMLSCVGLASKHAAG